MESIKIIQRNCIEFIRSEKKLKDSTALLSDLIEHSYISQAKIAEKIGLTPEAFNRKLRSNSWNVTQVASIVAILKKFDSDPFD